MRLAVPIIVLALAAVGCGGSDTTTSGDTDRQQVVETLEGLYAASANQDVGRFCAYLTPASQEQLTRKTMQILIEAKPTSCADTADLLLHLRGAVQEAKDARVEEVTVSGDSAKATARARHNGQHVGIATSHYNLVLTGDGWKFAPGPDLPLPPVGLPALPRLLRNPNPGRGPSCAAARKLVEASGKLAPDSRHQVYSRVRSADQPCP